MRSIRHLIVLAATVVSVGAVIAQLGSGAGDVSREERFVEGVCATALPWAQELFEIHDDAVHTRAAPGHDAGLLTLYGLAYRGTETARKYAAEVAKLEGPDGEAGRTAVGILESDARFAVQVMAEEERRVLKLPENITLLQSIRGLNRVEFALAQAFGSVAGARFMAAHTGMLQAFEGAASCMELDAVGRDSE